MMRCVCIYIHTHINIHLVSGSAKCKQMKANIKCTIIPEMM